MPNNRKLLAFYMAVTAVVVAIAGWEVMLQVAYGETRDLYDTIPWMAIWLAAILLSLDLIVRGWRYEAKEDLIAEMVGPILLEGGV